MLFSTPQSIARFAHEVGADLGGDDLVGASCRAMGDDAAVEVHDHAFAHGIERAVRCRTCRRWPCTIRLLESVGLIGEAPAVADRRGVAGGADHDLRALVGALARHLREHAVVADDQRDLGARSVRRITGMPRSPGSHGSTGTHGWSLR